MSFTPSFPVGSTVRNTDIVKEFRCGNMGGMRRSIKTNTLVIISDHTKDLYEDKWIGNVLHYTGMGKSGDQDIHFAQNKTLAESDTNGVDVHLFEVLSAGEYIYNGLVRLCDNPYQEIQKGEDGQPREVWIFPICLQSEQAPIDAAVLDRLQEAKRRKAQRLTAEQLRTKAEENQSERASSRAVKTNTFVRNPYVSEYAKLQANGRCQLCGSQAPFKDQNNKPYLETHHIEWLSEGGADTIENTVALCPNCHRKMHVLKLEEDIIKLQKR